MRKLEYELKLVNYGYEVGGSDCDSIAGWLHDSEIPAIQMTVIESETNGDICDYVYQGTFCGEKGAGWDHFRTHYQEVLHGINQDWRLIRFRVTVDGINLEYYSERFAKTTLIFLENLKNMGYGLEFSIPRKNKSNVTYTVQTHTDIASIRTTVIEYGDTSRREFEFMREFGAEYDSEPIVYVTEYVDI